jgi:hypothetical protein
MLVVLCSTVNAEPLRGNGSLKHGLEHLTCPERLEDNSVSLRLGLVLRLISLCGHVFPADNSLQALEQFRDGTESAFLWDLYT